MLVMRGDPRALGGKFFASKFVFKIVFEKMSFWSRLGVVLGGILGSFFVIFRSRIALGHRSSSKTSFSWKYYKT